MQALYAFFQSDNKDLSKGEKELLNSIEKIYDLYVYLLLLLIEIRDQAERIAAEAKNKRLPTESDLNPNTLFIDNTVLKQLSANASLKREATNRKISWQTDDELVRKILTTIKGSEEYIRYMNTTEHSYETDKQFMIDYRVEQLDALLIKLKASGIVPVDSVERVSYGSFVHLMDLEGNKIELWEPNDAEFAKMSTITTK